MKNIKTTVIGSYPIDINTLDFMNGYFNQKESSWNKYIRLAVNDQINAGIEMISDGQTRDSFLNIYARKLKGCRIRDRIEVIDKVEFKDYITVKDQKFIRDFLPKEKKLIGLITGPYTLTKSCVDLFYNDEKNLAFDFAKALRKEALGLEKYVDIISIDEPFFSMGVPEYCKELISIIVNNLKCPTRLHACGDVSGVIADLLEMPVDILSHEFKGLPRLFDAFEQYTFSKNICLGSVRSDDTKVESVEEIMNHIKKGIDVFGNKISQLSPDCGLKLLPREIAFQKLKNLAVAGERIYG